MRRVLPFLLLLTVISCRPSLEFEDPASPSPAVEAAMEGEDLAVNFPAEEGTLRVVIKASRKWSADFVNGRGSAWCALSAKKGGRGEAVLDIRVQANPDYDQRSASIIFQCGDLERTLVVTQKQKDALLLSSSRIDLGAKGGQFSIEVQANVDYTATLVGEAASWIEPLRTKGLDKSQRYFAAMPNEGVYRRSGQIVVKSLLGEETVTVYQQGEEPTLLLSASQETFPCEGGVLNVEVRANFDAVYSIPDDCTWIWEEETKSLSTNTFTFIVDPNQTHVSRSCTMTFSSADPGLSRKETVTIIQEPELYYESSDYSRDGEVSMLQEAEEGLGVNLILMGDGYADRDIESGLYLEDMKTALEAFFAIEPYRSFRHLFNAYMIVAVSKNDVYDPEAMTETAFSVDIRGGNGLTCNNLSKVIQYAGQALGGDSQRAFLAPKIIVVNSTEGRSVTYTYSAEGAGLSFCVKKSDFDYVIQHEVGGHAFGLLADEYVDSGVAATHDLQQFISEMATYHSYHRRMNLDVTPDPTKIIWRAFLADPRYDGQVGIFEGGYYFPRNVYRPAEYSVMNSRSSVFNAPSREAIYYWIHHLAYGEDWEYDYETFTEYDAINRHGYDQAPFPSTSPLRPVDISTLVAPPRNLED